MLQSHWRVIITLFLMFSTGKMINGLKDGRELFQSQGLCSNILAIYSLRPLKYIFHTILSIAKLVLFTIWTSHYLLSGPIKRQPEKYASVLLALICLWAWPLSSRWEGLVQFGISDCRPARAQAQFKFWPGVSAWSYLIIINRFR